MDLTLGTKYVIILKDKHMNVGDRMKSVAVLGLLIGLTSTNVFAQALKDCTTEVMDCKLEDATNFYKRTTLDQTVEAFSGLNADEPSIAPDSCDMFSSLNNKKGQRINVSLTDRDYMANIYVTEADHTTSKTASDVTFKVSVGSKFYYRLGNDIMTCELKASK